MSLFEPPAFFARALAALKRPWLKCLGRFVLIGLTAGYFAFALLILALRYAVLPQIENFRPNIEQLLSESINRPVSIRGIDAYWVGLRPALSLGGFEVRDQHQRSALMLDRVEAELAWDSLLFMQLRLARLEILGPNLVLRRDPDGKLFVAGLEIDTAPTGDRGFPDWLLAQHRVIVRDASVSWIDERRGAAPLTLKRLNFELDNNGRRHRFGFTAEPPADLAARLDIRGDFKGRTIDSPDTWQGDAYAELDYADLGAWRQWIDYPLELPQGHGALRLWLGAAQGQLKAVTADVRLANVRLRLRPDLPELDLLKLDGRLFGRRIGLGIEAGLRGMSLAMRDGLAIKSTDLKVAWQPGEKKRPAQGSASANNLDLGALVQLAGYLPIEPTLGARIATQSPTGVISNLDLSWVGDGESLQRWNLKGKFDRLGLSAFENRPGLAGFSGRIEGNSEGGHLALDSQHAWLDLPAVFSEPRIELDQLTAEIDWRHDPKDQRGLEVFLRQAQFQNRDASGDASGRWRALAQGPGEIDLSARVTRARGDAVWRYLPKVIGQNTRNWVRDAIVDGEATEASLVLSGDLRNFPFRDRKEGRFAIKSKAHGVVLKYAESWPRIENIDGDLLFEAAHMVVNAKSGQTAGVGLREVRAEIPDIERMDEILNIKGKAHGATANFLNFIEASPVGEQIDHFTEDMRAEGNGELSLALTLPLRRLTQTRVNGTYRFDGNRLTVDPDLPPLGEVRGQVNFSADHLEAKGVRAMLLGAPMTADIRTLGDGNVQVNAAGDFTVAALRRQFDLPLFDHLSGGAKWTGTVRVRKKTAEVGITSNLVGLSSSLPPPFNKTAGDALALRFERKPPTPAGRKVGAGGTAAAVAPPGVPRDQLGLTLGTVLRLQLERRHDVRPAAITRGLLLLGGADGNLPERGIQVAAKLPRADVDFWRRNLKANANGATAPDTAAKSPALPAIRFDLRADEFLLFGKTLRETRISGTRQDDLTRFEFKSRDLTGNFEWNETGAGKLSGKIAQLAINEAATAPAELNARASEVGNTMPALDLKIDRLQLKGHEFGSVALAAENREGIWHATIDLHNDDSTLKGDASWRPDAGEAARAETRLDFRLDAKSIEKLLGRLGYPEAVRRGTAKLSGQLAWQGSPFSIDYPSLGGTMTVDAMNGQFNKLEPGVGRLLGILSLQSLPRRITLDFRDIFSEGFAFSRISGQLSVAKGLMKTRELEVNGPSARVLMSGEVNLVNETQNLMVRVQPAVGETLAVGAMIANPLYGAVAWAAQKLFKDPLDRAFAFEYAVTGSWSDPKVDKIERNREPKTGE